jgi:hypothetical protein
MIITVCSVAIMISINRFSWGHFALYTKKAKRAAAAAAAEQAQAATSITTAAPQAAPQQQQTQQYSSMSGFGGPRSTMVLMETDGGLPRMAWGIVAFCSVLFFAVVLTSQSPLFVAFRRRTWQRLRGEREGVEEEEEDEGLLSDSKGSASWGVAEGCSAAGYGSAQPSNVPTFQQATFQPAAGSKQPAVTVSVSGGGFRRSPHANAVRQRFDHMVATMLPEGPQRLHTAAIPLAVM